MIEQDIFPAYAKSILKHFHLQKEVESRRRGMQHHLWDVFTLRFFRQAGCESDWANCELDGNSRWGVPDPTEVEVLDRLAAGVKKHQADIGFAYDMDGDRMAVVDEKGQVLWMDTTVALLPKMYSEFIPG